MKTSLTDPATFEEAMPVSTSFKAYLEVLFEREAKGRAEGRTEQGRRILLLLGRDRFGEPSAEVKAVLDGLTDVNRLEELTVQLRHAASWQAQLGASGPRRRSSRKKPSS
jgi:hypothetical protein